MATVAASAELPQAGLRRRRVARAVTVEWRDVGWAGRLALAAMVLSLTITVFLGVWIQQSVGRHLLDVRRELLQETVDDMLAEGELPLGPGSADPAATVAAAVDKRILGGDLVGVAIRDATGKLVFAQPAGMDAADADEAAVANHLLHVERHGDGLLHFVLPVPADDGALGSVEVLQQARTSDDVLVRVRRNLWLGLSAAVGSLGIAMGALAAVHASTVQRRRRDVERLLGDVVRAEDHERRRIVGALHDDVGQPLYRLLYGLEGCRARVDDAEVVSELDRLTALVREVDRTLRGELHRLHRPALDDLDLGSALQALAAECSKECGLAVDVAVDLPREPPPVVSLVVLRVVEEALVNVRKHARATSVSITARADGERICVDVTDDGIGCQRPAGLGLTTATERLRTIGGELIVGRGVAGGALVRLSAPFRQEAVR